MSDTILHHLALTINSIFVNNILLSYFLGMCSYLAVSKRVSTAIGLGTAVVFVLSITAPLNWIIYEFLLKEGALSWTGIPELAQLDLSYLSFITFIASIAATVQLVEMFIERTSEALYNTLGIFLPLITVNCAILGACFFLVERNYTFGESINFGISSGLGWALAIISMACIRQKLRYSNIPKGLRGLGITMLTTGLISMAFLAFGGMKLEKRKTPPISSQANQPQKPIQSAKDSHQSLSPSNSKTILPHP